MTRAAVLTVLSLLTLFAPAAGQGAAAFTRISQGGGLDPSISADGRRVAFSSTTRRLGNVQNQTGVNYLWSEGTVVQLTDPAARSFAPVISGDGRVVAFLSTADPTGNNPEHNPELFVWTVAGTVQVTAISTGAINDRFSLSFDGSRLAFSSTADLTGGNPDASEEIFVWNGTAFTQLTSSTPPPSSNGFSSRPSISADGRAVAFESNANFVPGRNGDGSPEIFLWRDGVISQVTEVASVVNLSGRSQLASISADGRSIAFVSRGNLMGQNPDQSQEMFLWNGASFTQLTSFPSPTFGVGHDLAPAAISGDGRSVAFQSRLNPFGRNADARHRPARRRPGDRLHRRDDLRERRPARPARALRQGDRPAAQRLPLGPDQPLHTLPGGGLGAAGRLGSGELLPARGSRSRHRGRQRAPGPPGVRAVAGAADACPMWPGRSGPPLHR